ncbi:hypothetical protein N0V83_010541 [Neocucurbitaria cava]|uniref:Heterokaryon incompatibility domain-containing protein n=1 Tax=Neocucurbitaria cava TaxID=798079 RepID=A0A9W8XYQ3_9PLEO|nr:hypothetical protein N0V83_010541 [Neocucurbitaria cava]
MEEKLRSNEIEVPQSGQVEARLNLDVSDFRICQICDDDLPIQSQWLRERRVTASKLDVSLFKNWLQTCCTKHGKHCEKPTWLSPKIPENLRVIDIRTRSVIKAQPDCIYAALSYVWGGPQYIINDAQMRKLPFCLPEPPVLSQTLVDAMALCHQIGIGYLWVDALCITQEPLVNDDKSFQL